MLGKQRERRVTRFPPLFLRGPWLPHVYLIEQHFTWHGFSSLSEQLNSVFMKTLLYFLSHAHFITYIISN